MDLFDYISDVLRITKDKRGKVMSQLRVELFIAAAQSANPESTLVPFPHCFYDLVNKEKRLAELLACIKDIPSLETLDFVAEKLPEKTWELLYWILTNPLTIQHVEMSQEALAAWTQETGLNFDGVMDPSRRIYLFKVVNPNLKPVFVKGKEEHGTVFAFHGSKFQNFHSIVHRGLLSDLNVRSVHGHGSYLSDSFNTSFGYTDWKRSWANSSLGNKVKCMAICEIVKYPGIKVRGQFQTTVAFSFGTQAASNASIAKLRPTIYVVDKDEYIQLSHLILLTDVEKTPETGDSDIPTQGFSRVPSNVNDFTDSGAQAGSSNK